MWSVRDKLDEVFDSSQYGLTKLTDEEQKWLAQDNEQPYPDYVEAECPQWLFAKIGNIEFCKSLNNPADANFRVHGHSRDEVLRRMTNEGFDVAATVYSPYGVRSKERISLPNCMTYQDGWIDAQDESSQLAAILCDVRPEHNKLDLWAMRIRQCHIFLITKGQFWLMMQLSKDWKILNLDWSAWGLRILN